MGTFPLRHDHPARCEYNACAFCPTGMPALRDRYPVLHETGYLAKPRPPHLQHEFYLLLSPYSPLPYSVSFVKERRLMRRIAFFFSMRRCSLLETNQRLRRTVLRTPLLTTFLRKRLSRES